MKQTPYKYDVTLTNQDVRELTGLNIYHAGQFLAQYGVKTSTYYVISYYRLRALIECGFVEKWKKDHGVKK